MFLVFIGQNASTGAPNRLTGRYSQCGRFKKFKTCKERDEYYDNWYSHNPSDKIWKCNKSTSRRFNLGSTVVGHIEHIEWINYTVKVVDECSITGKIRESWEEV